MTPEVRKLYRRVVIVYIVYIILGALFILIV